MTTGKTLRGPRPEIGERPRGYFVVIEGTDGSGKTTQAKRLLNRLLQAGFSAVYTQEPTEATPIGGLLDRVLRNEVKVAEEAFALLFAADRADHTRSVIEPHIGRGAIVVCDRYLYSSLAYQGAGMKTHLGLRWLRTINRYARRPDIVFFLDVPPEEGLRRTGKLPKQVNTMAVKEQRRKDDDKYFQEPEVQRRVREAYLRLFSFPAVSSPLSARPETSRVDGNLVVRIDASLPFETVHEQVFRSLQEFMKEKGETPTARTTV